MKRSRYFHIWTERSLRDSILKSIKTSPDKIYVLAAEEYEVDSIFSKELPKKLKKTFLKKNVALNFIFGAADPEYYNDRYHFPSYNLNVHLWPNFFLYYTLSAINLNNAVVADQIYSKVFISMNGSPHYHRCMMYDLLAKYDLDQYGNVSWNALNKKESYKWKYRKKPQPTPLSDNFQHTGNQFYLPLEWDTSFLNLVSETSTNVNFITEKTWIPLLYKKPFLVQCKQNFYKTFQEMGFVLYDEIFDYSFDSIENTEERTSAMLANIKKIADKDLTQLYNMILPKINHNFNHAIRMIYNREMIPEIILNHKYAKTKYERVIKNATDKAGKYKT